LVEDETSHERCRRNSFLFILYFSFHITRKAVHTHKKKHSSPTTSDRVARKASKLKSERDRMQRNNTTQKKKTLTLQ
jgi:hypothetical protein